MKREKIIEVLMKWFAKMDREYYHKKSIAGYIADELQTKEVSDLEIERWAAGKVNEIDPDEYGYGDLLIEGAKWYRKQINK